MSDYIQNSVSHGINRPYLYPRQFVAYQSNQNSIFSLEPELIRFLGFMISGGLMAILIISFRPFGAEAIHNLPSEGGDIVNQIGFSVLGALSGLAIINFANPNALKSFISPTWIGFFVAVIGSIALTPDPVEAVRPVALSLIAAFVTLAVILLPRSEQDFISALSFASLAALGLSYLGLVIVPDLAKHGFDIYEPQHSNLWRGHFIHKNIAGPVMSAIVIFGIYIFRSNSRLIGATVTIMALVFVIQTGSKTTSGFLPLAIFIVFFSRLFAQTYFTIFCLIIATIAVGLITVGSNYSPELQAITKMLLPDETFTGRTSLWAFGIDFIPDQLWFGYGFDNFWNTPPILNTPLPAYALWDVRNMVHGHNNYIDIFLSFGVIGGSLILYTLYVGPIINYMRAYKIKSNRKLADMFMMIIAFIFLLSFMETFAIRRSDPIWLMHIFAVFGLHIIARFQLTRPTV